MGVDPQEPALVGGAQVPRMGSEEVWLRESEDHWGTLTMAPRPEEPGKLVNERVPTEPGDYRGVLCECMGRGAWTWRAGGAA